MLPCSRTIFLFLIFLSCSVAVADSEERNPAQINGFGGAFLPIGIPGVIDSYPVAGVRLSHPLIGVDIEYGAWGFNANAVTMYNGSLSLRVDIPLDSLIDVFLGLGGSAYYYQRAPNANDPRITYEPQMVPGFHGLGGAFIKVTETIYLRSSFTYSVNPGHNLVADVGLTINFSGSNDSDSEDEN